MEDILQGNNFIFMIAIGILIMLAFAMAFVIFVNYSQKKILKEQMNSQQLAYEHQEKLLHSTILTQEVERKRIARDLHDEIGSKLNVIFLNIYRLRESDLAKSEIDVISNELETIINTTIDTTRRISHDLLPPTLEEFGLIEAIREMQHNFNQSDGFFIDFNLHGDDFKTENKLIELNLYRVLQELINNSIKHGEASEVTIDFSLNESRIKLGYQDNGKGFDNSDTSIKKGIGMKNIESRLHMIMADHQFSATPGKGIKMIIELDKKEPELEKRPI